jgi:transposase
MAPYSMDLRERVARAWDASGDADGVAGRFAVSRAWVHRLIQRRRETGSIGPRKQTKFRSRVLAGQEQRLVALITARPDATLAELREALPTTAALSTLWLEIDRLGLTVKKNGHVSERHPRRHESGSVKAASAPGEGRALLVLRARKKMDPSATPQASRPVARTPHGAPEHAR